VQQRQQPWGTRFLVLAVGAVLNVVLFEKSRELPGWVGRTSFKMKGAQGAARQKLLRLGFGKKMQGMVERDQEAMSCK